MKCPSCGAAVEGGRFCSDCGTALGKPECPGCGHKPPVGARYCNQCGAAMGGSAMSGSILPGAQGNRAVWWTGGALLLGLIVVIAYPLYGPDRAAAPPPVATGPAAGPARRPAGVPPDLSSMTMRQAADDLFDRVMRAVSANNSAEVVQFLPMALRAYELADQEAPLNADGKFHEVMLQLTGEFNAEALAGAEEILSEQPNYLLGLAMAGDASLALGDSASARAYYRRWLDSYASETAKNLPEYQEHGLMFPEMQARAEALGRDD